MACQSAMQKVISFCAVWISMPVLFVQHSYTDVDGKESASEDFGLFDKVGAENRAYEKGFGC